MTTYYRPLGFIEDAHAASAAVAAGQALPFLGGPAAFTLVEIIERTANGRRAKLARAGDHADQLTAYTTRLPTMALPGGGELTFSRPLIMGIINVTPDSFSDGGQHATTSAAIAHGRALAAAGAHILDIGGESTRPGAAPVSPAQEQDRVLPVIEGLKPLGLPISIDTRHAATMRAAVAAGAHIINDVSALTHDPESVSATARLGVPVVLMHARSDPRTMQDDPRYDDVTLDIYDYLADRVEAAVAAGVARAHIILDPGLGFGKTVAHNLQLINELGVLLGLGCPVLLGASRKSFIARTTEAGEVADRLPGSLAAALLGVAAGARILRVHDVAATRRALLLTRAVSNLSRD
jgi:dihydropteroate synthase